MRNKRGKRPAPRNAIVGAKSTGVEKYVLRLYVTNSSAASLLAIRTVTAICDNELAGVCDFEVIDLYKQPRLAKENQIIAIPTLIKKEPLPLRRLIGNMIDKESVLAGLTGPRPKAGEGLA